MKKTTPISLVMSREPQTVSPDTTISRAIEIFDQHDFHHLPVVKSDGTVVGIVSQSDIAVYHRFLSRNTTGQTYSSIRTTFTKVEEIMTPHPVQLRPEDPLALAAELFSENLFHAIPITSQGALVGIITSHDLICYAFDVVLD